MRVVFLVNDKVFLDLSTLAEMSNTELHFEQTTDLNDAYFRIFSKPSRNIDVLVVQDCFEGDSLTRFMLCAISNFPNIRPMYLGASGPQEWGFEYERYEPNELGLTRLISELGSPEFNEQIKGKKKTHADDIESLYKKYEVFLNCAGEGIVGIDQHGNITFVNAFACKLFEKNEKELLGSHLSDYALDSPLEFGSSTNSFSTNDSDKRRVGRGVIRSKNNRMTYVEYTQTFVGNSQDDTVSIMVVEDIGARVKFETKLKALANMDVVTGLYNRHYFKRTFEKERKSARIQKNNLALFYIDLDGFKKVNDQYGHIVGDKLLTSVAKRLQDSSRRSDLIARFGGDEFVILVSDTTSDDRNSRSTIDAIAKHFVTTLSEPYQIDGEMIHISASIGVSLIDQIEKSLDWYLEKADAAMYSVKRLGKCGYQIENKPEN